MPPPPADARSGLDADGFDASKVLRWFFAGVCLLVVGGEIALALLSRTYDLRTGNVPQAVMFLTGHFVIRAVSARERARTSRRLEARTARGMIVWALGLVLTLFPRPLALAQFAVAVALKAAGAIDLELFRRKATPPPDPDDAGPGAAR